MFRVSSRIRPRTARRVRRFPHTMRAPGMRHAGTTDCRNLAPLEGSIGEEAAARDPRSERVFRGCNIGAAERKKEEGCEKRGRCLRCRSWPAAGSARASARAAAVTRRPQAAGASPKPDLSQTPPRRNRYFEHFYNILKIWVFLKIMGYILSGFLVVISAKQTRRKRVMPPH